MRFLFTVLIGLLSANASLAVLIDSGDGTGNTGAPSPDPGWAYVGTRGSSLSAVYLGDGWVLTANHVGAGPVTFGGTLYSPVAGSSFRLDNGDGTLADLRLFAIFPYPALPLLPIAASTPSIGTDVILIGNGTDRGAVTSWDSNGPPPPGGIGGYEWLVTHSLRWGTNQVEDLPIDPILGTMSLTSFFDAGATLHEAAAANGDSGGALFVNNGGTWELTGILFAISTFIGQPADTTLYGNATHAADLAFYRDDILDIVSLPEPTGALPIGCLWVGLLARRRQRTSAAA